MFSNLWSESLLTRILEFAYLTQWVSLGNLHCIGPSTTVWMMIPQVCFGYPFVYNNGMFIVNSSKCITYRTFCHCSLSCQLSWTICAFMPFWKVYEPCISSEYLLRPNWRQFSMKNSFCHIHLSFTCVLMTIIFSVLKWDEYCYAIQLWVLIGLWHLLQLCMKFYIKDNHQYLIILL